MRIAIVHDHLGFRGGGERTALLLALHLKADFITAYARADTFSQYQKKLGIRLIKFSTRALKTRVIRFFWLRLIFWRRRKIFKNYDILIASGQTATEAVANFSRPNAIKIVYTHSTPRRVFDQYELSRLMYPLILRPAYALFARFWKGRYLKAIKKFDVNIANSENVRQRIRNHTGGEANYVIWPPILTNEFKWQADGDYFFSWGRVDESKRIELIVRAFKKMPREKLVVASGGPRLKKVREIAGAAKNINIIGWVSDNTLKDLAGKCRAAIYIPMDEDAGITHLEANATGKPYLGVREGGLIESTDDGRTGILIKADPDENDIISAVKKMTPDWCRERRKDCEDHAKKYGAEKFMAQMDRVIKDNSPGRLILGIDASRCEDPRFPGEEKRTGVEIYSMNIISFLIEAAGKKNIRVRLYTPRRIAYFPSAIQKVIPGGKGWTRRMLVDELKNSPPNFFFTPAYYIPKNAPKKSFAVIHDVIFKTHPGVYSFMERLSQKHALEKNLKRAEKIITVSEHTKNELTRHCRVSAEKVVSIPMAYKSRGDIERKKARKKQIIYIGRIEKKKSVDVLIKAFGKFMKKSGGLSARLKPLSGWKLVLAGKPGYGYESIIRLIRELNLADHVRLVGFVKEEEKWGLLAESSLFIHPSSLEGSSIPLYEAFDAGIPAIAADIPVMRENGRDAVLFFKPGDKNDLAEKITKLTSDDILRKNLTANGSKALKGLSWENAAESILSIIAG
ncbi:MAG: glycosyltransferase [Patescibacteria group bacterium]|jgi:glycosyltransferase involved in cell wall biosynthesis